MLQYQKIDVSERIDVNKTSASKECELCHYWFFKDVGFKFEEHVCNRCHDLFEVIREGVFGGIYFRDIYSGINEKWYKNSWKEFVHLKNIDAKFYVSDYYDVNVNKYGVKCGTSVGFLGK